MPGLKYEKQPKAPRRLRDKNAIDLRIAARGKDQVVAAEALAELRRRVGNLKDGVIPGWELEARGPFPAQWELI